MRRAAASGTHRLLSAAEMPPDDYESPWASLPFLDYSLGYTEKKNPGCDPVDINSCSRKTCASTQTSCRRGRERENKEQTPSAYLLHATCRSLRDAPPPLLGGETRRRRVTLGVGALLLAREDAAAAASALLFTGAVETIALTYNVLRVR